jgi:hypothetical protein
LSAVLIAILAMPLGFSPGLSLCVGTEGHVAIELTNAGCCRPAAVPDLTASDCASGCSDTVLRVSAADRSGTRHAPELPMSLAALPTWGVAPHLGHGASIDRDLQTSPPRRPRTTVLRC